MPELFRYMRQINKIWFNNDTLFGETPDGKILHQSLLWYPGLLRAADQERLIYEFGLDGIHWRGLDEDVSFESFFYEDAEPSPLQRFFLENPEINVPDIACRVGMDASTLSDYVNGFKKPTKETENKILERISHVRHHIKDLHTA